MSTASSMLWENEDNDPRDRVTWKRVALEAEILATFDAALTPSEPLELGFRKKEIELARLFDRLSTCDAHEMYRRLTLMLTDDPIAKRFARLVGQRRTRLLAFVGNARRREAHRAAK